MTSKTKHTVKGIFIEFICHEKNDTKFLVEISEYDISATSQECECCGSHGDVSVSFKCPGCGNHHEHTIRSW